MRTEEQIVYELLNVYHGGELSDDNVVNERLMRSFLRKHRASKLAKYFMDGVSFSEEIFQDLGVLEFQENNKSDFFKKLPPLILINNFGLVLRKGDYIIPLTSREAFERSKKNLINKGWPKATTSSQGAVIYVGLSELCKADLKSLKEITVASFNQEINSFDTERKITVEVSAVLYDPSSSPTYNWTIDPYPCPSEIIDEITTSTLARDLNLMIRTNIDQNMNKMVDQNEGVDGNV